MSATDKHLLAQAGFSLKMAADHVLHLENQNRDLAAKLAYYERREDAMKVANDQVALGMHPNITDFNVRVQGLMSLPDAEFNQIKAAMNYMAASTGAKVANDNTLGVLHDPRGSGSASAPASGGGSSGSPAMDRFAERVAALAYNNPSVY